MYVPERNASRTELLHSPGVQVINPNPHVASARGKHGELAPIRRPLRRPPTGAVLNAVGDVHRWLAGGWLDPDVTAGVVPEVLPFVVAQRFLRPHSSESQLLPIR